METGGEYMELQIKNVTETFVSEALDSIIKEYGMKCTCDICKTDVIAIALNRLKPQYATTNKGEALIRTNVFQVQKQVDIFLAVKEAINIVEKNSSH
jgi:competence protein ComFB